MIKKLGIVAILAVGLALGVLGVPATDAELATSLAPSETVCSSAPTWSDVGGGDNYFFCAASQCVKIIGLCSGNAALVLAGAVGGGIACGFGW